VKLAKRTIIGWPINQKGDTRHEPETAAALAIGVGNEESCLLDLRHDPN
jgi:hypothetical protein